MARQVNRLVDKYGCTESAFGKALKEASYREYIVQIHFTVHLAVSRR
jgi:hypothetical protein